MQSWNARFDALEINHLRSPALAHPVAFDPTALVDFAIDEGRTSELIDAPVPGPVRDVEPERPAVWNAEPHIEDDGIRIRINTPAQAVQPEVRPEPQAAPPPPALPEDPREAERGRPSFSLFGWRRQDGGNPSKGHEPRTHEQRGHEPRAHEPAPEPRVQTPAPPPAVSPEPDTPIDDLEIPAFLRRQMK